MFRCEVLDLTDEEAAVYMIEANRQRSKLLPSEKGLIYRLKDTLPHSYSGIADMQMESDDNEYKIEAYMLLTRLIPELQELVDNGVLSLRPAKALSYLSEEFQITVLEAMKYEDCSPTHEQAIRMRTLYAEGGLTREIIKEIMAEVKPNQRPRIVIRNENTLSHIPGDIPESKKEDYIAKALEFYEKAGGNHEQSINKDTGRH